MLIIVSRKMKFQRCFTAQSLDFNWISSHASSCTILRILMPLSITYQCQIFPGNHVSMECSICVQFSLRILFLRIFFLEPFQVPINYQQIPINTSIKNGIVKLVLYGVFNKTSIFTKCVHVFRNKNKIGGEVLDNSKLWTQWYF